MLPSHQPPSPIKHAQHLPRGLDGKWAALFVFTATALVAGDANAQGDLNQFSSLATQVVKVLQGIGITISAVGFIVAGVKYNSGDPGAKEQAKNAVIGSALVAGAVILTQFVKGFFT